MEDVLMHSVMLSMPQAAAIWLVILAIAVIAVVALALISRRSAPDHPDHFDHPDPLDRRVGDASGFAAERASADRYADEIEVAAERATATARHERDAWEQAQAHLEETWAAFEAADLVARRTSAAAAFGSPDSVAPARDAADPDAPADRERYLHRAATAACRRRELTVHELNDILAHRGDWDPQRHPVEQEVALHRAARRRALAAYRDAAAGERQAWHAAEVAADALRSLREEACVARLQVEAPMTTEHLWWAGHPLDADPALPAMSAPDESLTTTALPVYAAADDVEATVALPVYALADDVEATVALPVYALAEEAVPVEEAVPAVSLPVGSSPVGPLMVVPLPAEVWAALRVQAAVGPVVPAQAGAPSAESLRQPLVAAGVDAAGR